MAPKKRARVEETKFEHRKGVWWRDPTRCVVEMRLPKTVANLKLNFGSYDTELNAVITAPM